MFRPDYLAIFMQSYAAMFQIRIISYGYSCCVLELLKLFKPGFRQNTVFLQRPSSCVVTNLYNALHTVNTRQYISTVIYIYIYIHTHTHTHTHSQVTLRQHVSTVNGHLQANREHF